MNNKAIIKQLITKYLANGGSQNFVDSLPFGYSLGKEAKLREALKKLQVSSSKTQAPTPKEQLPNRIIQLGKTDNEQVYADLISDYPPQLHQTYLDRKTHFLKACSLKMQLNTLSPESEKEAFALQRQIWKLFVLVDDAFDKLAYWRKNKRILTDEISDDFSELSQTEMVQRRNTLRSNASNRAKTILKMEEQLANADSSKKLRIEDKLLKKRAALRQIHLQIEMLDGMIKK